MTLIENPPPHFLINSQFIMSFSRSFLVQFIVLWVLVVGVASAQTGADFAVDGHGIGDSQSTPPPFFR